MNPIDFLNQTPVPDAMARLSGLYEHSDWIVAQALGQRPFRSLTGFRMALQGAVRDANREAQIALIRAHPALTGKARIDTSIAPDSRSEQSLIGLDRCTADEHQALHELNDAYQQKFGWPFVVAVKGPRGKGLPRREIIETLARRLVSSPERELEECLRQIHRIAELRLHDRFDVSTVRGERVWDSCQALAQHTDIPGELTVMFLSPAHRACATTIERLMREAGFDRTEIDAVGNVVGRYDGATPGVPWLLTGSHYDTVRNGGKYDGRLGIMVPIEVVRELSQQDRRLPFGIEVVAFSEEEGVRFAATFLGSSALTGGFDTGWLTLQDPQGVTLGQALASAGLASEPSAIATLARDPADYLGFVEVHIEQGPVLNRLGLPLGVVTAINGSVRHRVRLTGQASHAGTTPMDQRRDAACAAAEIVLAVESLASQHPSSVGTVGQLTVPNGSINTIPGECELSLDLRAPSNVTRDALLGAVMTHVTQVCQRRDVRVDTQEVMRASAAPCDPTLKGLWAQALKDIGLEPFELPSGAGHDAMKLHETMPQAMLFVRGENQGISHNPLESTTAQDMDLAVVAFEAFCHRLASTRQGNK